MPADRAPQGLKCRRRDGARVDMLRSVNTDAGRAAAPAAGSLPPHAATVISMATSWARVMDARHQTDGSEVEARLDDEPTAWLTAERATSAR